MNWINKTARAILSLCITILAIASLAFYLFDQSPVPLDEGYYLSEESGFFDRNAVQERQALIDVGKQLQLHQPIFYFHLHSSKFPPSLHKLLPIRERRSIKALCSEGASWKELLNRRNYLVSLLNKDIPYEIKVAIIDLLSEKESRAYEAKFSRIQSDLSSLFKYQNSSNSLLTSSKGLPSHFLPHLQWNGTQNRWHMKLKEFFLLDWGRSWVDGRFVFKKISEALFWTVLLNGLAFLCLFLCAIPLGKYWALHPSSIWTFVSRQFSYILTVAPVFWIATLCIAFLTSAYGLPIFTLAGAGDYMDFSCEVLILPLLVLFIGGIGYLARQFEDNYSSELDKAYIKMAMARGVNKRTVFNQYAVKNAIIPLITLAGSTLPSLISGALVIEVLFNIPGMGRLTWHSVLSRDWPMIYAIILLLGLLSWLGRWGADRLSHQIDPRTKMEAI